MYNLLIVDDEPLTREFFKSNISSINPEWVTAGEAEDGTSALQFLETHEVDLVITDIKMPVMDGLELCEKIKSKKTEQEIVILSGYDEFSYAQKAIKFQVHGYLLKPIKIPALMDVLNEVASRISKRKKQEIAFLTMQNLSTDYQSHICRSYLKAIIENLHTEIKVLHPMLYKLKIDLMQAQGVILILRLDTESIIQQKLPPEDLPIFRYILFQASTEIVEDNKEGIAILDSSENVVIYLSGDSAEELEQKCRSIYTKVSCFLSTYTNLTVTGFSGSAKSDILEMYSSYHDALNCYNLWVVSGDDTFYSSQKTEAKNQNRIAAIGKLCSEVITSLSNKSEANFHIAVSDLISHIEIYNTSTVINYLLLLLQYVDKYKASSNIEQYIACLKKISAYCAACNNAYNKTDITNFYISVVRSMWNDESEKYDEPAQDLVEASKEFIYQHFSEPITLSQIADTLNVSPNYLSKIFHESVGESYIKFITRIRMEYAAKLLKANPAEHIFTIAAETGYCNLKHFNFVFKEYFHMTPTEYQKKS